MRVVWNHNMGKVSHCQARGLHKPRELMQMWEPKEENIVHVGPAGEEDLVRVHDWNYVRRVLNRTMPNGYANRDYTVMEHILLANGLMIGAVEEAIKGDPQIVCAPACGFHHAGYSYGGNYCTFNGLLIAIQRARFMHPDSLREVLILDGDGHYGDGTDDILRVTRIGGIMNVSRMFEQRNGAWRRITREALQLKHWDLVLYQAGADAHLADPYGVGYLDTSEYRERDEMVFGYCAQNHIPCVWNLAGGYDGEHTNALHTDTYRIASKAARSLTWSLVDEATLPEADLPKDFRVGGSAPQCVVQDACLAQGGTAY